MIISIKHPVLMDFENIEIDEKVTVDHLLNTYSIYIRDQNHWQVYKGKSKLQKSSSLAEQGVVNGDKLYLVLGK
jgi:hypothetical protein